ncbi:MULTISPECIES: DNA polymerase I [unclassified Aeromicrobium]|uniref:DNA polymerase I n=1 Tax=unclassified Aeromicrobium TaxID=2633570 RepID=UPI00070219CB|nr:MULTISPECIES: DNA polymerase I [unclassified Aeromicrobium]KQP26355.1 DNA polymerase I [Aeromicrobium sp. Leaf272]KQP85052.1 DNA polymerase I [Aeromicrobium sp. Leaf291]
MDRLLLIDGHSVAYRAFFALPVENFSTTTGQHTNAVFGFTSMLINVLRDEQPTHVGVAFDVSRRTFRTEEYAEYKGNRAKSPDEFKGQVTLIKDVVAALGITSFEKDGFEADDIIGTLATQAQAAGMEVLICTGDRDALQLVTDTTTVLYPRKGVSDLARMTPAAVEEKYGVTPEHYPEIAALVGETSDNLPGVPGVGPKTAAKWINQHGSLEALVADVDAVPGKAGESLREHLDSVLRNRRINALVRDLELPAKPADLAFSTEWNRDAIHQVFDALEFAALRTRLFEYLGGGDEATTDAASVEVEVDLPGEGGLAAWIDEHLGEEAVGVEVAGVLRPVGPRVDTVTIATPGGRAVSLSPESLGPDDDAALQGWLADPARPKVMHDAKGQLHALAAQGWTMQGLVADTALAAYLVRPDQRSYDLADLALRSLKRDIAVSDDSGQLAFDDDTAGAEGAAQRARATLDLWTVLREELEQQESLGLLDDLELPLVDVLARAETAGIAVDTDHLDALHAEFTERMVAAADEAYAAIGREVNLGSPKQLQEVLFDQLDMPKTKRTKTGYTTDAEALQQLFVKTEHPFLEHLLAHRDVTRLRQTVEGLQKTVQPDGRIHTTYFQTIAATGRLSSADPNLQNIPIRTESGRRIREAFTVGEGYETLLTADYSQIEMRIMADLSEDADLIEAFRSGHDFHTVMAAKVFEREPTDIDGGLRARIKAMNYGLAYGLSAYGLSQQLQISTGEAQGLMDDYFETFGGVRDYLHGVVEEARQTGFTATILGRRRYLPDLVSDNRQRREMAERMALNAPIQGSAADIIKVAMLGVDAALREQGLRSRLLLQVHDELVLEVAAGERDTLEALVREQMAAAADLSVPLDVSVGTGRTWHEAAH